MSDLKEIIDSLLENYIGYKGGNLIVFADKSNISIGQSLISSAYELDTEKYKNLTLVNLDFYKNGDPLNRLPYDLKLKIEENLSSNNKDYNIVVCIQQVLDGENQMQAEIREIATKYGKMGEILGCSNDLIESAFARKNIHRFSEELYDFILLEERITVESQNGTKLYVTLDNQKYNLVNSNGILVPGNCINLIPAEIFTYPIDVEGTLIIDCSYGPLMKQSRFIGNYKHLKDILMKKPIIWHIKNSEIIGLQCDDPNIEEFVRYYIFEMDPENGNKIGEFGLPANLAILNKEISGNLCFDEKARLHIANGDGYHEGTSCPYSSKIHGDGLISTATLISGRLGKPFMINNSYSPEIFKYLS